MDKHNRKTSHREKRSVIKYQVTQIYKRVSLWRFKMKVGHFCIMREGDLIRIYTNSYEYYEFIQILIRKY